MSCPRSPSVTDEPRMHVRAPQELHDEEEQEEERHPHHEGDDQLLEEIAGEQAHGVTSLRDGRSQPLGADVPAEMHALEADVGRGGVRLGAGLGQVRARARTR